MSSDSLTSTLHRTPEPSRPPSSQTIWTSSTTSTTTPQPDGWFEDDEAQARVLVVTTGARAFSIPVAQVREVVRPVGLRRVPGAPPVVRGIVNVRGTIVTVLDLAVLLEQSRAVTPGSVVLLEYGARLVGLAVDVVRDVRATGVDNATSEPELTPLDAVALCARHLLSAEEAGP